MAIKQQITAVGALLLGMHLAAGPATAQVFAETPNTQHVEQNGILSMEMENAAIVNKWVKIEGVSGAGVKCPANGGHSYRGMNHTFARFHIRVTKPGRYTIWTLAKGGGTADYVKNEFNMRLDPNLSINDPITRLDEGQPAIDFKITKDSKYVMPKSMLEAPMTQLWLSRMPRDRNGDRFSKMRTSDADKAGLAYGWRSLAKSKRPYQRGEPVGTMWWEISAGDHVVEVYGNGETDWAIDKIVLELNSTKAPTGSGPAETAMGKVTEMPSALFNRKMFVIPEAGSAPGALSIFTGKQGFGIGTGFLFQGGYGSPSKLCDASGRFRIQIR